MPTSEAISAITAARYVNLATFRRDGREVHTPIWLAGVDGIYYAFSAGNAGKVKRIRANARARIATCTANGKLTGDWTDARARILSDANEIATAYRALHAKYGWVMWLTDRFARVTGRYAKRAMLEIALL